MDEVAVKTLQVLPSEILNDILSNDLGTSFFLLWQCGDRELNSRLSQCKELKFVWDGLRPCVWTPNALNSLLHLEKLVISNAHHVTKWPIHGITGIGQLPVGLKELSLSLVNSANLLSSLHVCCPLLTKLQLVQTLSDLNAHLESVVWPEKLEYLSLDSCDSSPRVPMNRFFANLPPRLQTLEGGMFLEFSPGERINWPPNLQHFTGLVYRNPANTPTTPTNTTTAAGVDGVKSIETQRSREEFHLLGGPFPGQLQSLSIRYILYRQEIEVDWSKLPESVTHVHIDANVRLPDPDLLPRGLLHLSIGYLTIAGWHALHSLEHHHYSREDFENFRRRAPPKLKFCQLSYPPNSTILFEDVQNGTIPDSLTELSITCDSKDRLEKHGLILPSHLVQLSLLQVPSQLVQDPSFILPETLRTLKFISFSETVELKWQLPANLSELHMDILRFCSDQGAMAIPRKLRDLECVNDAFPDTSGIHDLPSTITRLVILVMRWRSPSISVSRNPKNSVPAADAPVESQKAELKTYGNLFLASKASQLPPSLTSLIIRPAKLFADVYEGRLISTWLLDLDQGLPLRELSIHTFIELSDCHAYFTRLPPSLLVLSSPAAHFSGKHFSSLPPRLRVLRIPHLDSTYFDTKLDHFRTLPKTITELQCSLQSSVKKRDIWPLLPNLTTIEISEP